MGKPRLLMLDEPSLGLAPLMVREIFNIVADLRSTGVSILLVEQNARAALQISDYGYVLETGISRSRGRAPSWPPIRAWRHLSGPKGRRLMEVPQMAQYGVLGAPAPEPAVASVASWSQFMSSASHWKEILLTDLSVPPVNSTLLAEARHLLLAPAGLDDIALSGVLASIHTHDVDFADLYFQYSRMESWSLEEGIVKAGSFSIDRGVGIRAVHGEKQAFAYSDDISLVALNEAAVAARAIGRQGSPRSRRSIAWARRIRCTRRPIRSPRCRKKPRSPCWNASSRWRASATRAWRR
jgi:hypothetical protein